MGLHLFPFFCNCSVLSNIQVCFVIVQTIVGSSVFRCTGISHVVVGLDCAFELGDISCSLVANARRLLKMLYCFLVTSAFIIIYNVY